MLFQVDQPVVVVAVIIFVNVAVVFTIGLVVFVVVVVVVVIIVDVSVVVIAVVNAVDAVVVVSSFIQLWCYIDDDVTRSETNTKYNFRFKGEQDRFQMTTQRRQPKIK